MKLVDVATAKFNATEDKKKALAEIMVLYTDRVLQEVVKNQYTEDKDVYNVFNKYLTSYKAFADKVHINPDGLYTALKTFKPLLMKSYDTYKALKEMQSEKVN